MKCHTVICKEEYLVKFQSEIEDVIYMQSGVPYTYFNIKGCNVLEEKEQLDYTLLNDVDTFLIESLEEYTISLIYILVNRFPQKQVISLDSKTTNIWSEHEVLYIKDTEIMSQYIKGKTMYVYSDVAGKNGHIEKRGNISLVYSSLQVMQSLCWARKRVSLGEKNPDKTILLIEFSGKNAGMGDIVISAQQYIRLARQRGWNAVVNLTEENQYVSHVGDNMWDYYFEQPSGISVEEALQSKYVIRGQENNFGVLPWVANPLCDMKEALTEKIYLKEEVQSEFLKHTLIHTLHTKRVLGVIARGSDLAKCTHLKIDIEKMISEVKTVLESGYEYIFLATEDKSYQKLFEAEFAGRLLYVDQKRICHDYEKEEYKYVADLLGIEPENRREWGKQYLFITYCLSSCSALLYSIPCGALRLANIWRDKPFEMLACTFEAVSAAESGHRKNTIHIHECEVFLQDMKSVVIYGLGDVAQMIYPILSKYRDKIIACDKRAAFEKYTFHGIEVISPEKLSLMKSDAKILITSPRCGKEIQLELEQLGIAEERIVQLDY